MPSNLLERTLRYRFKQPSTYHKEARQTEEDKHRITTHSRISQTEMANMRKNNENHSKSSHRINVFYPLLTHFARKSTEKSWNICAFQQKMLLLHHERANKLDRLGESFLYDGSGILPPTPTGGYLLFTISGISNSLYILLYIWLSKEKKSNHQGVRQEIWILTPYTLYNI